MADAKLPKPSSMRALMSSKSVAQLYVENFQAAIADGYLSQVEVNTLRTQWDDLPNLAKWGAASTLGTAALAKAGIVYSGALPTE